MKCHKCGGTKYYSGGCNGEWECWGECSQPSEPKQKKGQFFIRKTPNEDGFHPIFVEGGSEMIQIGDTANLSDTQIKPNLLAITKLAEDNFEYVDDNETFEIWRVRK